MAKRVNTKPQGSKSNINSSQEENIKADLFHNTTGIESNIPLEIANPEKVEVATISSKSIDKNPNISVSKQSKFSLNSNVFIEVHKSNLLQYFSAGCIFPSRYSSQKAFPDPQSINENGLLVSNGIVSNDSDHVLIQIDASAIDKSLLSTNGGFGLYSGIIPISRIIKIYFNGYETKKKIIDDSIIRDAGNIPETIIEIEFPENLPKIILNDLKIVPHDFENQMNRFDKILGLISGTRNFNLLTFNQTGKFKTFSDHSLFAIQAIDETFGSEIASGGNLSIYYKWLFSNSCPSDRPLLKWIFNRVYSNVNFTDSDTNEFELLCTKSNLFLDQEKQVKDIFSSLRNSLGRKKALTNILALQSNNSLALYVFAYLRIFGTNQNPEIPRVELMNSKITIYSEYAFATLNFFFGYKQLRNFEDRTHILDQNILGVIKIPTKPNIKFELNTEFDYRIIDTVFNFVFGIDGNYLDKYKNILVEPNDTCLSLEGYECYSSVIYGKLYFRIIKLDLTEQLQKLPNEITIFSEFGLVCHRIGLKRYLIGLDELIGNPKSILRFVYYSKSELIEAIRANKVDAEEVKNRISLSQKYNEL
jgi:hypothetical protein